MVLKVRLRVVLESILKWNRGRSDNSQEFYFQMDSIARRKWRSMNNIQKDNWPSILRFLDDSPLVSLPWEHVVLRMFVGNFIAVNESNL